MVTPVSARFPRSAVGEDRNIRHQRNPNNPPKTMSKTGQSALVMQNILMRVYKELLTLS